MKLLTLRDFQSLACLSDGVMIALLSSGQLPCQIDKQGMLMIDIHDSAVDTAVAAVATARENLNEKIVASVVEQVSPIVKTMIDEAFRIAIVQAQERGILSPLAPSTKTE